MFCVYSARLLSKVSGYDQHAPLPSTSNENPALAVPLALDRLRAAIAVLRDLLQCVSRAARYRHTKNFRSASTLRPVTLPIGPLVRLSQALLSCTAEDKVRGRRALLTDLDSDPVFADRGLR